MSDQTFDQNDFADQFGIQRPDRDAVALLQAQLERHGEEGATFASIMHSCALCYDDALAAIWAMYADGKVQPSAGTHKGRIINKWVLTELVAKVDPDQVAKVAEQILRSRILAILSMQPNPWPESAIRNRLRHHPRADISAALRALVASGGIRDYMPGTFTMGDTRKTTNRKHLYAINQ